MGRPFLEQIVSAKVGGETTILNNEITCNFSLILTNKDLKTFDMMWKLKTF